MKTRLTNLKEKKHKLKPICFKARILNLKRRNKVQITQQK